MVIINTTGKQNQVWLDKPYGTVGCPDADEAYRSGFTAGVENQKSKLSSLSISGNGEYVSEDGVSAVTVDVPQEEIHLEPLGAVFSANGNYDIAVHSGYDGFRSPANIYVEVPQTGHTDQEMEDSWNSGYTSGYTDGQASVDCTDFYNSGYTDGYESGYTDGSEDGFDSGYTSGVTDGYASGKTDAWQPAYDSGYTDGAASVDCQPLYDSGYTDGYSSGRTDGYDDGWRPGYNSGYTDGINAAGGDYASGYTDGFDAGYDSGVTDGYASGYTSGKTDGFGEGYDSGYTDGAASVDCQPLYDSGYTDGYESGHTDGYDERAAMLTAMTITANGAYESVEGWSAVTVNVSGYSQQDLDNAYASGHTSGVTDGAAQQKALLSATAFTTNGTYTRTDGWSAVTVNVPQTGYTQADLDAAFASGYSAGLSECSGYTPSSVSGDITNKFVYSGHSAQSVQLSSPDFLDIVTSMYVNGEQITPVSAITMEPGETYYIDYYTNTNYNYVPSASFNGTYVVETEVRGAHITQLQGCYGACKGLTGATLSSAITEVRATFLNCENLISVNAGNNTMIVRDNSFRNCGSLTGITLSPSLIGANAFAGSGLRSFSIGGNCTFIGSAAFSACTALTDVSINGRSIASAQYIGSSIFRGCSSLSAVSFNEYAVSIPTGMFEDCTALTAITLPGVNISAEAFYNTGLRGITVPEGVTEVGGRAFYGCSHLGSAVLPSTITNIGDAAFAGTNLLTGVTVNATTPPSLATSSGANASLGGTNVNIYVPASALENYKAASDFVMYAQNDKIFPIQ